MEALLASAAAIFEAPECSAFEVLARQLAALDCPSDGDDLLFVVCHGTEIARDDGPEARCDTGVVSCCRRTAGLSVGSTDVCWRQTFCLNVLAHSHCVLRTSICTYDSVAPVLLYAAERRVYADPARLLPGTTHEGYPLLHFAVHDYADCSGFALGVGHVLCLELMASVHAVSGSASHSTPPSLQPGIKFVPWSPGNGETLLFQGAVAHDALLATYRSKSAAAESARWRLARAIWPEDASERHVLMRGPLGERHAQVSVTSQLPGPTSGFPFWRVDAPSDASAEIVCKPMFVCMHWRVLMSDVLAPHFPPFARAMPATGPI